MKRIDALAGASRDRLQTLTGKVLDPETDPELQSLAGDAARVLDVPIALVSLVLERTQLLRAAVGLAGEIDVAKGTDREVSFCQFVVRDGRRFEVRDARTDERVPKELVERFGVRAYIGEPIRIDGHVVGSLCGMDVKPRVFNEREQVELAELGDRVSRRLQELARQSATPNPTLLARAISPAFAELRNIVTPVYMNVQSMRVALADLAPLARLAGEMAANPGAPPPALLESLSQSIAALDDLREIVAGLEGSAQPLARTLGAVEKLMLSGAYDGSAAEAMELGARLAHHQLKLTGGVAWSPVGPGLRVGVATIVIASVLSASLSALAQAANAPVEGGARAVGNYVLFELRAPGFPDRDLHACARSLQPLLEGNPFLTVVAIDGALRIRVPSGGDRA